MMRGVREVAFSLVLAASLFLGLDSITARSYIDGPSMQPTLRAGQVLLTSRIGISGVTQRAYATAHQEEAPGQGWVPPRGAIVTFTHPSDPNRVLVKRVIALPGEEISIDRSGRVFVDRQELDEPYLVFHDDRSMAPMKVPEGSVFLMGDNRPQSGDSRMFGPVPRANLIGLAVLRYWPVPDIGLLMDLLPR